MAKTTKPHNKILPNAASRFCGPSGSRRSSLAKAPSVIRIIALVVVIAFSLETCLQAAPLDTLKPVRQAEGQVTGSLAAGFEIEAAADSTGTPAECFKLLQAGPMSIKELMRRTHLAESTIKQDINGLLQLGLIVKVSPKRYGINIEGRPQLKNPQAQDEVYEYLCNLEHPWRIYVKQRPYIKAQITEILKLYAPFRLQHKWTTIDDIKDDILARCRRGDYSGFQLNWDDRERAKYYQGFIKRAAAVNAAIKYIIRNSGAFNAETLVAAIEARPRFGISPIRSRKAGT